MSFQVADELAARNRRRNSAAAAMSALISASE
jgi:hypothetical protein